VRTEQQGEGKNGTRIAREGGVYGRDGQKELCRGNDREFGADRKKGSGAGIYHLYKKIKGGREEEEGGMAGKGG